MERPSIGPIKHRQGTETILLVEDEEPLRKMTHELLVDSGYTVLEANDGLEALEIAQRHIGPIHLLLTDVVMPRMAGRELAGSMAVLHPPIKTLYMSGYIGYSGTGLAEINSELALLPKPFTRDALLQKVREKLENLGGGSHASLDHPLRSRLDSMISDEVKIMPRVLIIDDDESTRRLLRDRLKDVYEIIDIGDPEGALADVLEHKPDAILLDLMMPNFSGFEVCQTLASLSFTQHIPIFIVSGYSGTSYKAYCEKLGAAGYFEKPIDFTYLKACLAAALSAKRPERRDKVRIRLRVALRLRGTDQGGTSFEDSANTEDISANGFVCRCKVTLKKDSTVEIFMLGEGEKYVGTARVAWIESGETPYPRHGFYFVKKIGEWVLK